MSSKGINNVSNREVAVSFSTRVPQMSAMAVCDTYFGVFNGGDPLIVDCSAKERQGRCWV